MDQNLFQRVKYKNVWPIHFKRRPGLQTQLHFRQLFTQRLDPNVFNCYSTCTGKSPSAVTTFTEVLHIIATAILRKGGITRLKKNSIETVYLCAGGHTRWRYASGRGLPVHTTNEHVGGAPHCNPFRLVLNFAYAPSWVSIGHLFKCSAYL